MSKISALLKIFILNLAYILYKSALSGISTPATKEIFMDTNISLFNTNTNRDPNNLVLTNEEKDQIVRRTEKVLSNVINKLKLNQEQVVIARNILLRKIEKLMIEKIKIQIEKSSEPTNVTSDQQNKTENDSLSEESQLKHENRTDEQEIDQSIQTNAEPEKKVSEEENFEVNVSIEEINQEKEYTKENTIIENLEFQIISKNDQSDNLIRLKSKPIDFKITSYKLHEIAKRDIIDETLEKNCLELVFLKSQFTILKSTWDNLNTQEKFVNTLVEKRDSLQKNLEQYTEKQEKLLLEYQKRDEELMKLFENNEFGEDDKIAKEQLSKIKFSKKIITITSLNLGEQQKKLDEKEKECINFQQAYEQIRYLNKEYWNSFAHRLGECSGLLSKIPTTIKEEGTENDSSDGYNELQDELTELLKQIIVLKEKARMESGALVSFTIKPKEFLTSCYEENHKLYDLINDQYISSTEKIQVFVQQLTQKLEEYADKNISANGTELQTKLREYKAMREKINTQINYLNALQKEMIFRMTDLYNKLNAQYRYEKNYFTDWSYMTPLVGQKEVPKQLDKVVNEN